MANKTKSKLIFAACIGIGALLILYIGSTNSYAERKYLNGITALWTTNESYIFLQIDTTVERQSGWELLVEKLFDTWTLHQRRTRKNLTVFHLRGQQLEQYNQEDFDATGQIVPIDGVIHLIQGGYSVTGFRWGRDHFVKIDAGDLKRAQEILRSKNYLGTNGWNQLDWQELGHIGDNYDKVFPVGDSPPATLHIRTGTPLFNSLGNVVQNAPVTVSLSVTGDERTLLNLSQNYERVDGREFTR